MQVWEGEAAAWGKPDYQVRLKATGRGKGETRPLPLNQPVWEPAAYDAPLATLCRQAGVAPKALAARGNGTETPSPTHLPELLLACDAESLHRAGEQVAAELTARFGSPGTHERAALVLGIFALREASGG